MFSSHHTLSGRYSGAFVVMLYFCCGFLALELGQTRAQATETAIPTIQPLKKNTVCPTEFSQLSQNLSADLREYLNRTYSRNRIKRQAIAISFPELQPLAIADQNSESKNQVKQLFLTVRSHSPGSLINSDTAYWLFLVETKNGWRLAMAFQRVGNATPEDVSNGAIADAVKTWLRDNCSKS
jgi:hypothetical protein